MRVRSAPFPWGAVALLVLSALPTARGRSVRAQSLFDETLDRAMDGYFAAVYEGESRYVGATIDRVLDLDPSYGALIERLRRGRRYAAMAPGVYETSHPIAGTEHHYVWVVPESYDPATPIAVQVMLHGGISREDPRGGGRGPIENLIRAPHVTVLPSGWRDSKWWHRSQLENLPSILRRLQADLNVDENRIGLAGISDGGSAVYYFAMLDATPWAHFMAFIGNLRVLSSVDVEGDLVASNLRNRPFLTINTEDDRLYPFDRVAPTLRSLVASGVDIDMVEQEGYGHDTQWWALQVRRIESFAQGHPRDPTPSKLSWATTDPEHSGRLHGLEILELGTARGQVALADPPGLADLFPVGQLPGRVDLEWRGNHLVAWTREVRHFRVWLDAGAIDFTLPIIVDVNGEPYLEETRTPDRRTLLERFAVDRDRTRLCVAVIDIRLPSGR